MSQTEIAGQAIWSIGPHSCRFAVTEFAVATNGMFCQRHGTVLPETDPAAASAHPDRATMVENGFGDGLFLITPSAAWI